MGTEIPDEDVAAVTGKSDCLDQVSVVTSQADRKSGEEFWVQSPHLQIKVNRLRKTAQKSVMHLIAINIV